jgi:hypothetical protein
MVANRTRKGTHLAKEDWGYADFDIWDRGIPLCDADWHYAPADLLRDYEATRALVPQTPTAPANASELSPLEKLQLVTEFAIARAGPFGERFLIRSEMQAHLVQFLADRRLVAYGFLLPRKLSDIPVRIPRDLFELRFINWADASIKGAGLAFVSVRVLRASNAQKIDGRLPAIAPAQRPQGRPSAHAHIQRAIASLFADGTLPNGKSRKADIEVVRQRVRQLFPTEHPTYRGLSDSKIRKSLLDAEDERLEERRKRR